MTDVLEIFAPYGPGSLFGALLVLVVLYFGKQFLEEFKAQNERKANIDLKREERKQDEVDERAQRDRERSQMEGRIAAQMERSNALMEAMKALMESVVTSNEVLHADLANSQARSQGMAAKESEMTEMQAIAAIVLSFAVPFAVQLIKTEAMTGKAARILALGCSLLAGVVTGFVGGVPADPGAWVTCAFAVVGGVQAAYTLFKSVGITSKWLDALLGVTVGGKE